LLKLQILVSQDLLFSGKKKKISNAKRDGCIPPFGKEKEFVFWIYPDKPPPQVVV